MPPADALVLCCVVVVFAGVQSVFGVGLLVFGTPTLLLFGFPFEQVLAYLLPCSIVISLLQVLSGGGFTLEPIRKGFLLFTAPAVVAGTLLVLLYGAKLDLRAVVGLMLLLTALTRVLGPARDAVGSYIRNHLNPLLAALGFVHGLSNLGGGMLALVVGSAYQDKRTIRKHIAFGYGLMASLQLATLFATTPVDLASVWLILPVVAALTYHVLGQRLFRAAGQTAYRWGLTALIAVFGILLIATA